MECRGRGSPTVVLVTGLGERAENWSKTTNPSDEREAVYPGVARFSRVCAYDRPGTAAAATSGYELTALHAGGAADDGERRRRRPRCAAEGIAPTRPLRARRPFPRRSHRRALRERTSQEGRRPRPRRRAVRGPGRWAHARATHGLRVVELAGDPGQAAWVRGRRLHRPHAAAAGRVTGSEGPDDRAQCRPVRDHPGGDRLGSAPCLRRSGLRRRPLALPTRGAGQARGEVPRG